MNIDQIFADVSEQMRRDFSKAQNALQHAGLKGDANEKVFRQFLQTYLPRSLDVITGVLVDSFGNQSRQLDVVICDAAKTPIFFKAENVRVIPVECAYAVFEVKACLSSPELKIAYENMKSVKSLKKVAYFNPNKGGVAYTYNLYGKDWDYWPLHHFVFSFDSPGLKTVRDNLESLQNQNAVHERIDMVGVLNKGVVLNRMSDGNFYSLPTPNSKLIYTETERSLLLFFTLVSIVLNQSSMNSFNFHPYLGQINFGNWA